jgi:hypothetical protein
MDRHALLAQWAKLLETNALGGALDKKPIALREIVRIPGPRAGVLHVNAGIDAGRLLSALSKNSEAMARQLVPWEFSHFAIYMHGRWVRMEADWSDDLAEKDIRLSALGKYPRGQGRWIVGKSETGSVIRLGFDDRLAHLLVAGETRSGKSTAVRGAISQLSQDPSVRLAMADLKYGDSLKVLAHCPNRIGPLVTTIEETREMLSWCVAEMRDRYAHNGGHGRPRLIVVIEEAQELIGKQGDDASREMLRKLVSQGGGAGCHVVLTTQHPDVEMFQDRSIRRNLAGKLALRVEDYDASKVVVGGPSPRADYLLGCGDAFVIVSWCHHRLQVARLTDRELTHLPHGDPLMAEWPDFDAECAGTLPMESETGFDAQETVISLIGAHYDKGRPWLKDALEQETGNRPGSSRASRLLDWGRDTNALLRRYRHKLALTA